MLEKHGYAKSVKDDDDTSRRSTINSCQKSLLLQTTIHEKCDNYLITVNLTDGYKVMVFEINTLGVDGRFLNLVCREEDDPHRVSRDILEWHNMQTI